VRDRRDDVIDLVRSAGGLLLGIGAVVLLTRKAGSGDWSEFARTLVVVVPTLVLYLVSVLAPPAGENLGGRSWRALLAIAAILLAPVAMLQLLDWLGADAGADLWLAAVFAATALLAVQAALRTQVPYILLLSAIAALVSWLFLWEKVAHPSTGTTRWILIAAAVLLLVTAVELARRGAIGAREIATVGGLAAVLPGVIGVVVGAFATVGEGFRTLLGTEEGSTGAGAAHASGLETFGWDLYLLIVSILLVWAGSRVRSRGLGYVGGLGVLTFIVSVGMQITRLELGRAPQTGVGGWPIVLIVLGAGGLLLPLLVRREP
jgi:uncharacterized membrane protein